MSKYFPECPGCGIDIYCPGFRLCTVCAEQARAAKQAPGNVNDQREDQ